MEAVKLESIFGINMAISGNGAQINDVDSMFTASCWPNSNQSDFSENNRLILDSSINDSESNNLLLEPPLRHKEENDSKASVEAALDGLLLTSQNMNIAELKPLPPFSGFSAALNINGISGHHYQAISQQLPEENNNFPSYSEQNIVSSSTCNTENEKITLYDPDKINFPDCVEADSVNTEIKFENTENDTRIKSEIGEYDISSIEDIAAIIGSAIADTTVPNPPESDDLTCSRDSWMDLDAWIDNACVDQQKTVLASTDGISEFLISNNNNNNSVPNNNTINEFSKSPNISDHREKTNNNSSTLHCLLTQQNNMPLLQYRLENGSSIKQENCISSNNYASDIVSTSNSPSNVVSTTDNLLYTVNERFMSQYGVHIINEDPRLSRSENPRQIFSHSTSNLSSTSNKKSRRPLKKHNTSNSTIFSTDQALGLLGKEKPVHRCSVCNRGFLNKSNIKVHLRTHTGEKPFRCDTCAKAFRQKAHLLKHQQIHKRIGRD